MREVLTCHVVHGVPLPPSVSHAYIDQVVAFTSKMWGQWYVTSAVPFRVYSNFIREARFRLSPFMSTDPCRIQRFRHPEFARLGIGPFIGELLQAVDARMAGASPHHMLLYAGKT